MKFPLKKLPPSRRWLLFVIVVFVILTMPASWRRGIWTMTLGRFFAPPVAERSPMPDEESRKLPPSDYVELKIRR